jgi:DNA-binding NtrC family response regulator
MTARIIIVDDDAAFRGILVDILRTEGYELLEAGTAEQALDSLASTSVDLVIADQRMPGLDGIELTRRIRSADRPPAVIVMTAYGTIPRAVEAVRAGATDYLTKPLESPAAVRGLVRRVLAERPAQEPAGYEFLTRAPNMLEQLALLDRAAATDATVLIWGESGTGKELLAHRLHRRSARASGPFVVVNCAALPQSVVESELFGHERGAFTGADRRHRGHFEVASGGTLFLDEIGELGEPVQAKLLRALEQRTIERVGGSGPIEVDFRLVAATNRNIAAEVAAGRFRSDLYYRLEVVSIAVPPLRDRAGDIDLLVPHLLEQLTRRLGLPDKPIEAAALDRLREYHWPGNVRELRNVLERALIASGASIAAVDVPQLGGPQRDASPRAAAPEQPLSLEERERQAILEALERTGGHREKAAKALGISVRTLYNRLKRYGIT